MKAIQLKQSGKPSVLQIQEVPTPIPGNGQVCVKIQTIGINYAEILSRKGLYGWAPKKPYVLGMEAFGTIDKLGGGVKREIGEKVVVGTQYGCYAEYIVIDHQKALPAQEDYSAEENAAFTVNYMTAWISLFEMARLRSSDTVLVQAAAGGVGTAAVQLAKKYGCKVFGTAGNDEKMAVLKKMNTDAAINYREKDFEQEIREITNNLGVDVVLEVVGGDIYKKSLRLLSPFGRIVVAGFASLDYKKWNPMSIWKTLRAIPRANIKNMSEYSYGVLSSHIGYLLKHPQLMTTIWSDLNRFVKQNQIRPIIGKVFAFDEVPKAHDFMESRKSFGKIVIKI